MARDSSVPPEYFEAPHSLQSMDNTTHSGLIAIGALATISTIFTLLLLGFITYRMVCWRNHYHSFVGYNQCVMLIYQLLLADFLQSLGFLISFHWAGLGQIVGPSSSCFTQGWLIQVGDVGSGFFVLAIALHTTYQVILSRRLEYKWVVRAILLIWAVTIFLTSLAPIISGRYVFLRAGSWCWISAEHPNLRLLLHYLWIFIVQFGSIVVYTSGFYYLYLSKRPGAMLIQGSSIDAIRRAAGAMLAYALVYTIMTLPLAIGRMAAMSGNTFSDSYYLAVGALFTSAGWVDALLYALTRRSLLFAELDPNAASPETHQLHASKNTTSSSGKSALRVRGKEYGGFQRQDSTDSMIDKGFAGLGGIKLDRTIEVNTSDDVESDGTKSERTNVVEAFGR